MSGGCSGHRASECHTRSEIVAGKDSVTGRPQGHSLTPRFRETKT